ncbi:MAG: ImmA/IrrE family metallo-endopeptidase [Luteitalea sp.]|nr:ImmA/IrrE family metallo-endopeptidase [Luteitalea sp.]
METLVGSTIRVARRKSRMSQADLARRLGISASYLNLLEHNHRSVSADLLLRVSHILPIDLKSLSPAETGRIAGELLEVFGDPVFENQEVLASEIRELAATLPGTAQAVVRLYDAYCAARDSAQDLGAQLLTDGSTPVGAQRSRFPMDEVSDILQRHLNYFPELEYGADKLVHDAALHSDALFASLADYLKRARGIEVRIEKAGLMRLAVRRYDPAKRILWLSEVLRRGSRNFQLAHQVGLLTQEAALDRIADDPLLTTEESKALCRVALANYFASSILMPYDAFLKAAQDERYDIELLGHRFRASFEQTCHRLTTLRRPGAEGIPFHMLRVDIAGNISKRFTPIGVPFGRFAGACPRWNVFEAFMTPGMVRTQLSQMPDGKVFFEVARTVRKDSGGYRAPRSQYAIAVGCDVSYASQMVYADGLDLASRDAFVPVGPTCRLCDRMDCEQRAHPRMQHALAVNQNVRGVSFYAPIID